MGFLNGNSNYGFFAGSEPSTGGTVTSSFTTGYVPYATSATNLGNSGMFYDAGAGFFGVGTITPATVFNVVSNETANLRGILLELYNDVTAATGARFIGSRARGTSATPTAVLLNDNLVSFTARGYKASTYSATVGGIDIYAGGNWTNAATLTYITFSGVTSGTTVAEWGRFVGGNLLLNTTTNSGFRLDVNGTVRLNGILTFQTNDTVVQHGSVLGNIIAGNTTNTVGANEKNIIIIGNANNLSAVTSNTSDIVIGRTNTVSANVSLLSIIGSFNSSASGNLNCIGNDNDMPSANYGSVLGNSNEINNAAVAVVAAGLFIVGNVNVAGHDHSGIFGSSQTTTAANQLLLAHQSGTTNDGYNDVYFGTGVRRLPVLADYMNMVTLNGPGAANDTDKDGASIRISGGKGTGTGTGGDVIFATTDPAVSGTTLQTRANRWWVKYDSGYLSTRDTPTEMLDMNGNILLNTAGNKIKIKNGTNASIGSATLVAGTVTVSTTAALTASLIFLSVTTIGGTPGVLSYTITNGTDFTINSSDAGDTSTIAYIIIDSV